MALFDLVNESGNDEAILPLWLVSQYQLMIVGIHLQPKMVLSPLIATWQMYHLLQAVTS